MKKAGHYVVAVCKEYAMQHTFRTLGAFLAGCAMFATPAAAGSAYGGYDISVLELLNDGPTELAVICPLTVYDAGSPDFVVAKGMITFARKSASNWRLLLQGTPNKFHVVNATTGGPITPVAIWDDAHHTTTTGWIGVLIRKNQGLSPGDTTWLVAKDNVGPNYVFIDARP
jgi:hypothetical protein